MNSKNGFRAMAHNGEDAAPKAARDVVDFHIRWNEFRTTAQMLGERLELSDAERETLNWLIALADRVGSVDILNK